MARAIVVLLSAVLAGCSSPAIIATQSIQRGDQLNNENRYEEAIDQYQAFLKVSPQLGLYRNPSQEADVSRKLAHAYSTQGKYRESFSYLKKALAIDSTLSTNRLEVIDDYRELGVVKAYMGDYSEAMRFLNKSLSLSEGMQKSAKDVKKISLADTYLSLAQVHLTLGNFKEAETFGRKALNIYNDIPDEAVGLIECQLLLGIVLRDRGNLDEAIALLTASEAISEKQKLNTARQHQALGEVYFLKGEAEKGIRHKMLAIEQAEQSQIKPQMVMMYLRMGDAYQKLGDPARAEFFYQKAMSVKLHMDADTLGFIPSSNMRFADAQKAFQHYSRSGATIGTALVSLRLGELRAQNNDLDSSLIMFSAAHDAFNKAGSNEGMAKASLELAGIFTRKEQYDLARQHLARAQALTLQPELSWQIRLRKGVIEETTGSFDSAFHSYSEAVAVIEKMRGNFSIEEFKTLFANAKVEVYDRLITLLLKNKLNSLNTESAVRQAFDYNEQSRSRTFLDMLGNKKIEPKDVADTSLLEQEQLLRLKIRQLTKQQGTSGDPVAEKRTAGQLDQAYREFDHVLSTIKLNNPAYSTVMNVNPPGTREIQKSLDPETAILEYWMSEGALVIWVVTKDNIFSKVVAASKQELQRLLRGCRNGISYQDAEMTNNSLKQLHAILIAPVRDRITGFKNLVIVPHRSLHFLPFQALLSEKNIYLVEEFIITYAPASSIYYYCQQRKKNNGMAFLGMALGDAAVGSHPTLPGTKMEVALLSQLYDQFESKFGNSCDETFLKNNIERFDYVHIATHGVFNDQEPVYSYLLFSPTEKDDGRLSVHEIFALNIKSRFVTLSACETALGELSEGDELVGLSRAFIYAGSSAVLVSLWKVEDSSTALLMTRFHQYITSGRTPAQALCLAQRDLIHKQMDEPKNKDLRSVDVRNLTSNINRKTIDHPFFWAPFVLVGNGHAK